MIAKYYFLFRVCVKTISCYLKAMRAGEFVYTSIISNRVFLHLIKGFLFFPTELFFYVLCVRWLTQLFEKRKLLYGLILLGVK